MILFRQVIQAEKRKRDGHIKETKNSKLEAKNCGTVLIKFRVGGNIRFLSHAETVRLFQRACLRAGIKTAYSQGFNPRPKLSLPLPRSVGVESDDELLCLRVKTDGQSVSSFSPLDIDGFKAGLSTQLPAGCEVLSVSVAEANTTPRPRQTTYLLPVRPEYLNEKLKDRIKRLLAETGLNLERRWGPKSPKLKNVNVRPFLKSIKLGDKGIVVECEISSAGSIRPCEILKLLELDVEMLAAPIRRTNVKFVARRSFGMRVTGHETRATE